MDGSWSNRRTTFTIGGALGAIASLVTIVSFVMAHSTSAPSSSSQNPAPPSHQSSVSGGSGTSDTSGGSGTSGTSGASGTASTASSYLSYCGQNAGPSYCQCTLHWFKANVSQAQFARDLAMLLQWNSSQVGDPPKDMVMATLACPGG